MPQVQDHQTVHIVKQTDGKNPQTARAEVQFAQELGQISAERGRTEPDADVVEIENEAPRGHVRKRIRSDLTDRLLGQVDAGE